MIPYPPLATADYAGLVSTAAQTFAGAKTFSRVNLTGSGTEMLSLSQGTPTSGVTAGYQAFEIKPLADASVHRLMSMWLEANGSTSGLNRSYRAIEGNVMIPAGDTGAYTSTNALVGMLFQAIYRGDTTGSCNTGKGIRAFVGKDFGTGNMTAAVGIEVAVSNFSSTGGTLATARGIQILSAAAGSGGAAITTYYGLQIEAQTAAGTNWAIHCAGGNHYLNGNVGIGSTTMPTANGGKVLGFGDNTDQPTYALPCIYAKGTELYTADGSGNETLQTPHSQTAPAWLYDEDAHEQVDESANNRLGIVVYTNNTRLHRLFEKLVNGDELPSDPDARKIRHVETFAEHNQRLGLTGSRARVVVDHAAAEQAAAQKRAAEITQWTLAKARYDQALAQWQAGERQLDERPSPPGPRPENYQTRELPARVQRELAKGRTARGEG